MAWFRRQAVRLELDARAAYTVWAPGYAAEAHNPLMRAEQRAMEALLPRGPVARALDVGTGTGRYLHVLARTGARLIVGVDLSWAMLTRGAAPPSRRHGLLICGDALALPFASGSFDLVTASLMVGDVADLAGWAREAGRVLRPGGHLVYSDFHEGWAPLGWQRTLEDGGRAFVVPFEPHTTRDHHCALARAGLTMLDCREPRLDNARDDRVRAFRRTWGDPPVAIAILARKPDDAGPRPVRADGLRAR